MSQIRHRPGELSGGKQQRVAVARALANRPKLLLADETTGNLGTRIRDPRVALFAEPADERLGTILATHDLSLAPQTDRVIELRDGRIVQDSVEKRMAVAA